MAKRTDKKGSKEAKPETDLFDRALNILHEASVRSVKVRGRPLRVVEAGVEDEVIAMLFQGISVHTIHDWLKHERGVDVSVSSLYRFKKSIKGVLEAPELQETLNEIGTRLDVLEQLQCLLAESKQRIVRMQELEKLVLTRAGNMAIEQHRKILETYQECLVGRLSGNRPGIEQMVRAMR